jgi:hypothetical protein
MNGTPGSRTQYSKSPYSCNKKQVGVTVSGFGIPILGARKLRKTASLILELLFQSIANCKKLKIKKIKKSTFPILHPVFCSPLSSYGNRWEDFLPGLGRQPESSWWCPCFDQGLKQVLEQSGSGALQWRRRQWRQPTQFAWFFRFGMPLFRSVFPSFTSLIIY